MEGRLTGDFFPSFLSPALKKVFALMGKHLDGFSPKVEIAQYLLNVSN